MKKLPILLFLILPIFCFSQKIDSVLFKKASKVIIKNNFSASENFIKSGKALMQKGFMIGSKDEQFEQIISEPIVLSFGRQKIYVICSDNAIIISSRYKVNTKIQWTFFSDTKSDYDPIEYNKRSTRDHDCFQNMIELAKLLPGKVLFSE